MLCDRYWLSKVMCVLDALVPEKSEVVARYWGMQFIVSTYKKTGHFLGWSYMKNVTLIWRIAKLREGIFGIYTALTPKPEIFRE